MAGVKITKFSGLNRKSNPYARAEHVATTCLDVDLSEGYLKPLRTDKKVSDITGRSLFIEYCCYIASQNCKASFEKIPRHCNYLVSTEHRQYPTISTIDQACKGEFYRLGFPDFPAPKPVNLQAPRGNFNREDRSYCYTLVKSLDLVDEMESHPSEASTSLTVDNDYQVMINGFPTVFDPLYKITKIRLYCSVTSLDYGSDQKMRRAVYLHVADIPVGASFYIHEPHTRYGELLKREDCAPAPEIMKSIQFCGNGQLAGIVDCDVWFSEPLEPHVWNEAFILSTFISKPIRLLATENLTYVLTDGRPSIIETESPCQTQGCRRVNVLDESFPLVSYDSASTYNGACFYASTEGIVMLAGGTARIVTSEIISKQEWLQMLPWTMRGVVHNGWYYGTTDKETFRFKVPDPIHENASGNHLTNLSINATAWYKTNQNRLHYADASGIHEFANGTDWKQFTWKGSIINTPSFFVWSAYKLLQDYEPASVKHILYSRHRNEMVKQPNLLGDHTVIDSMPQRLKAGYSGLELEVEIKSKGAVYEYHVATSTRELAAQ